MKQILVIQVSQKDKPSWDSISYINNEFDFIINSLEKQASVIRLQLDKEYNIEDFIQNTLPNKVSHKFPLNIIYYSSSINYSQFISSILETKYKLVHHFVLFGNLMTQPRRWASYSQLLSDQQVNLIGASKAMIDMSQKVFTKPRTTLIPFSSDTVSPAISAPPPPMKKPKFFFQGRFVPSKGVILLIDIFSKPPMLDYELHLIGRADLFSERLHGKYSDTLKIEELLKRTPPNIIIHGHKSQKELTNIISKLDCFINPSTFHDDDFGIANLQAYSLNKYLILSEWGGLKDFLKFPQTYSIKVTRSSTPYRVDKSEMLKGIKAFLEDYKKALHLQRDHSVFSRENISKTWLNTLIHEQNCKKRGLVISPEYQNYLKLYIQRDKNPFKLHDPTAQVTYKYFYNKF